MLESLGLNVPTSEEFPGCFVRGANRKSIFARSRCSPGALDFDTYNFETTNREYMYSIFIFVVGYVAILVGFIVEIRIIRRFCNFRLKLFAKIKSIRFICDCYLSLLENGPLFLFWSIQRQTVTENVCVSPRHRGYFNETKVFVSESISFK